MLVLLSGVSGAGKDTIKRELIKRNKNITSLPSYYGTSKHLLNERLESGKIIVKDIDVNGTENLVKLLGKDTRIVTIFLRVPKEELHRRLLQRTPDADPKEITLRLNRFDYEESKIGVYDYVLKNNNLEKTIQIITAIIENESKVKNVEF